MNGHLGPARMALALLGTLAVGCASAQGWTRVTTPSFVLRTDLAPADAARAGEALESTRDALISAAWPGIDFADFAPTEVFALAAAPDFERTFGPHLDGLFISGTPPAFFLRGGPDQWNVSAAPTALQRTSVLRHELVHQLAAIVFAHEPRWFAEGLAQFLETIHYTPDRRSVVLGGVNHVALGRYNRHRSVTVAQLLDPRTNWWSAPDSEIDGLYGLSWALVYWLYNNRSPAFARYQIELARGTEPGQAWAIAFPDLDPAALDREVHRFLQFPGHTEVTLPVRGRAAAVSIEAVDAAGRLAIEAQLAFLAQAFHPDKRQELGRQGLADLEAALAIDPTNTRALRLRPFSDPREQLARVRAAATARPNDAEAQLLLGDVLRASAPNGPEREAAYRRAIALSPGNPWALNALAWLLDQTGRTPAAVPYALRAVKRAPWSPAVLDTYASAFFHSGACARALAAQQRAVDLLPDLERGSPLGAELRGRLEQYRAKCGDRRS